MLEDDGVSEEPSTDMGVVSMEVSAMVWSWVRVWSKELSRSDVSMEATGWCSFSTTSGVLSTDESILEMGLVGVAGSWVMMAEASMKEESAVIMWGDPWPGVEEPRGVGEEVEGAGEVHSWDVLTWFTCGGKVDEE